MKGIHAIDLYHFDLIDPYTRIPQRCLYPMYDKRHPSGRLEQSEHIGF